MSEYTPAIKADALTKQYDDVYGLNNLDLRVGHNEIYGFLGANGAGKSTTIGLFLDYLRPTSGRVRILGRDPQTDLVEIHDRVGVLPDRFGLYENKSARQHVMFVVETKQADDEPEEVLERVGLEDAVDEKVDGFSHGMEQRLALAMALVGNPELLILDEPFSGLDPNGVRRLRDIVHEEHKLGATVFFSSHVLGQVELICDRVGVLHEGELVAEGTLEELQNRTGLPETATMETVFVELTNSRPNDGGTVQ